ncbi:putative UDP-Glycosyltransferase/glycogen phosphorylase [Vibrio nigripulchritudo MADA3029]|uniref:glycosyltransferase n=1 Tax=Vibrio nigripulchritudo TaxID=28173 RepID=UPI0003B1C2F8|nr:glycosyltransferase [Vibrio nigripulchritudo]CCN46305.1 putative UDP-Glycosyltransferase/glycogen phosphorylase [Vibrio nigripulchritudo MADA3020]CCN52630.1 putative UDP-Glycosyltransferase/glycogen phosphorylase [Vibrio nigripulchritudo MADA3021]CCN59087.1 putative UDP-Glycosyltransferase/glycogen phosphorylase [Vibrio nigripulchritudo MADA3029]
MNNVIIFSNHLLAHSETFIRAQGEALTQYRAQYFGSDRVESGLQLPEARTHIVKSGMFGVITDRLLKLGIILPNLLSRFQSLRPDLIHAHFGPNGLTALSLAEKLDTPLVVTFHGFDVIERPSLEKHGRLHLRYMDKRFELADRATQFIAVSDSIKERMVRLGFPEDKIIRHYIGIDTDFFTPSESIKREKIILCVGRMIPIKGHRFLIEAMSKVQKLAPDYKLVLVGDGEEKAHLEKLAHSKGIQVEFTGRQTPEQVKHWMQRASVYVQPSVRMPNGQEEALALTIVEAQAVGTPAVVFNTGGMPEAIIDGETGTVVSEESVDELADAIVNLSYDHERWDLYSKNAVEFVHKTHNLGKQCAALESIYKNVLQQD